jgi:hypothetical protein
VPRNRGPLVGCPAISVWVPSHLRRILQQLSEEAASMSLRELTVNENLISTNACPIKSLLARLDAMKVRPSAAEKRLRGGFQWHG